MENIRQKFALAILTPIIVGLIGSMATVYSDVISLKKEMSHAKELTETKLNHIIDGLKDVKDTLRSIEKRVYK